MLLKKLYVTWGKRNKQVYTNIKSATTKYLNYTSINKTNVLIVDVLLYGYARHKVL